VLEVKRKKGESFESLYRRFQKRLFLSGKMLEVKKSRFKRAPLTKREKRESALRRKKISDKISYLKRLGKWDNSMEVGEIMKR
jgi:ribosomal protein S21